LITDVFKILDFFLRIKTHYPLGVRSSTTENIP